MNFYQKLEQTINEILEKEELPPDTVGIDFAGKDHCRAKKYEQALEESLTAARGYELMGNEYDKERAYCLDRAAKCLDLMIPKRKHVESTLLLCARLKEKSAELFLSVMKYTDAGYSFLRAAYGYASAGEIEKAKELLAKSDNTFQLTEMEYNELRARVINAIEEATNANE